MCCQVKCSGCGKTTWGGCGRHLPSVYKSIAEGQHCLCRDWPGVDLNAQSTADADAPQLKSFPYGYCTIMCCCHSFALFILFVVFCNFLIWSTQMLNYLFGYASFTIDDIMVLCENVSSYNEQLSNLSIEFPRQAIALSNQNFTSIIPNCYPDSSRRKIRAKSHRCVKSETARRRSNSSSTRRRRRKAGYGRKRGFLEF
ncbi:hypothetical protein Ddye_006590 [Dipteronia dyeriana]|uniref:Uncharacterized protein n=1 Tax=Dipteronia dyeriana TaxID=168575 RepID=A0AAE0CQU3_9ROSI|nr:hypothetical protein Ddye_006590 [Dipteronia dyeriana]